jgi:hypothetical protein
MQKIKEEKPMKGQLLELVNGIMKDHKDIDLEETPVVFVWRYKENPDIEFKLMIHKPKESSSIVVH